MRHHAIGLGSHPGFDDDVRKRARRRRLQVPFRDRRLVGLPFVGGIILSFDPMPRPGGESTPGRLARSGPEALTFSILFSPDGKSMASTTISDPGKWTRWTELSLSPENVKRRTSIGAVWLAQQM